MPELIADWLVTAPGIASTLAVFALGMAIGLSIKVTRGRPDTLERMYHAEAAHRWALQTISAQTDEIGRLRSQVQAQAEAMAETVRRHLLGEEK